MVVVKKQTIMINGLPTRRVCVLTELALLPPDILDTIAMKDTTHAGYGQAASRQGCIVAPENGGKLLRR